jgi:hypothetical protein
MKGQGVENRRTSANTKLVNGVWLFTVLLRREGESEYNGEEEEGNEGLVGGYIDFLLFARWGLDSMDINVLNDRCKDIIYCTAIKIGWIIGGGFPAFISFHHFANWPAPFFFGSLTRTAFISYPTVYLSIL